MIRCSLNRQEVFFCYKFAVAAAEVDETVDCSMHANTCIADRIPANTFQCNEIQADEIAAACTFSAEQVALCFEILGEDITELTTELSFEYFEDGQLRRLWSVRACNVFVLGCFLGYRDCQFASGVVSL